MVDDWPSRLMAQSDNGSPPAEKKTKGRSYRRNYRTFIRGPLPLEWFSLAASLGRKPLAVALAVWWRVGVERRHSVCLSMESCGLFGIRTRRDRLKALDELERAGLVAVERSRTKSPRVTVMEVQPNGHPSDG